MTVQTDTICIFLNIEGKKELKEITMEFQANYVKDMEREERGSCGYY